MAAGEFEVIARFFSGCDQGEGVDLGVGDDCAIVRLLPGERLAVSVDTMVQGVHFFRDTAPADVAFRAVAAAASDLAAMGARPLAMTLALTLPAAEESWLRDFSEGLGAAGAAHGLPLVGGDTTRGPLTVSVQVMGALPAMGALLRRGAEPGDTLYVSGCLGDAAAALAVLRGEWLPDTRDRSYLLDRYHRPRARIDLGQQLLDVASAAIDISDGLLADAGHLAAASAVHIRIDGRAVPLSPALASHPDRGCALRWALTGGDDYQLCFTLPPGSPPPSDCTRVGAVASGTGVDCSVDPGVAEGYRHF